MPMYDLKCPTESGGCGHEKLDVYQQREIIQEFCDECGMERYVRFWRPGTVVGAHGDECDVTMRHGICHPDGSPRRFTSKSEMKRVATSMGLENHVVHRGGKGSDKSKHTQRWV